VSELLRRRGWPQAVCPEWADLSLPGPAESADRRRTLVLVGAYYLDIETIGDEIVMIGILPDGKGHRAFLEETKRSESLLKREGLLSLLDPRRCAAGAEFIYPEFDEVPAALCRLLPEGATLYTYNGHSSDLPKLKKAFGVDLRARMHSVDLMWECRRDGFLGTLKELKKIAGFEPHRQRPLHNGKDYRADVPTIRTLLQRGVAIIRYPNEYHQTPALKMGGPGVQRSGSTPWTPTVRPAPHDRTDVIWQDSPAPQDPHVTAEIEAMADEAELGDDPKGSSSRAAVGLGNPSRI